jgi:hypothetical protein
MYRIHFSRSVNPDKFYDTSINPKEVYTHDKETAWELWWLLVTEANLLHVNVYNKNGTKLSPEKGLHFME